MKTIPAIFVRGMLLAAIGTGLLTAEDPESRSGAVMAEVWPFKAPEGVASKVIFEQWRASVPPEQAETIPLDGLSLAAREELSMVRVAGVLTAPVTGHYAFRIHAPGALPDHRPDQTELWIQNAETGAWRLAQRTGNPNKASGRTWLEAGVPRRFELWAMGRGPSAVDWEVVDFGAKDPQTGDATVRLARQLVPATALGPRVPAPDDRHGDGLRDSWKRLHGLAGDDATGSNSLWGDPDGDGLPNWQEQLAGTDPMNADTDGRDGLVRWEIWRDIPGRYVFDLRRAGHFPAGPREVRFLDRLEIPTGNGDHYGSRVRGWLVAPADGEYIFHVTADNSAELWLSENESWQSKRLVARTEQKGSGGPRWTRRDEKGETVPLHAEQTGRVTLKAGARYYIEILHKQDSATDYCAVGWVLPGADDPELIGGKHLVSWKPCPSDTADDGLPDDWQRASGLLGAEVDPAMRHAEADPDGDGASNLEEWLAGTDPLDPTDFPETGRMLLSEAWTGIPGRSVADLTGHPRYPAEPDVTTRIDNLDFGQEGENYGVRLRGYLAAPDDGVYHFSISGNNACVLYLGESEDKFTKRPVARVEVGTRWRSFHNSGGHPRSGPVPLERGKRYYIEVLFKRGGGEQHGQADHSSVAWTRPGREESVISPEYFSPYRPDPRDLDDDDLPDEWERLHGLDPTDPSGNNGAWGDPDGDGLENLREFQFGLDPNVADVHGTPGLALWEVWENLDGLLDAHREEGGLAVGLWRDLRFPLDATRREWRDALDAPRRQGTHFGARLRAHIVAPATGDYVFSIAGRDVGELYLSPDQSKFNRSRIASFRHGTGFRSWDLRPGQMSKPVRLEAGQTYYLEALHARGGFHYTDDFFAIAWKRPQSDTFEVIGADHLVAFFRDPNDRDDDDLPDDWESHHGLDSTDPRGDHGPHGDPDRDGLTNLEEYRLGTHPRKADTDGDGISDYDEIHVYGTNPLVSDITPPVNVADVDLDLPRVESGNWHSGHDGSIISASRRGAVEFEVDLERPGLYMVRVHAVAHSSAGHVPPLPLVVDIGGRRIGHMQVAGTPVARGWLTPTLAAGRHLIRIENRNVTLGVTLEILGVEILLHDGSAPGGEPLAAWLAAFHAARNSVENAPLSSPVSPLCLEGTARYPHLVTLTTAAATVQAAEALTGRWFADVPLDPDRATAVTAIFESGAHASDLEIEWTATNLFESQGPLFLRPGASLKIVAVPPGASGAENSVVSLDGAPLHSGPAGTLRIVTFGDAADHVLAASVATADGARHEARLEVRVTGGTFGTPPPVAAGSSGIWTLESIGGDLELEADPAVTLRDLAPAEASPRRVEVALAADAADHNRVLARLPAAGGIVDAAAIPAFRVVDSARSLDAHVVNVLPDGTRVVELGILIEGPVPPGLVLRINLIVPDAVFASGGTSLELRAGDFDENGIARVTIYKAPGTGVAAVCHTIETATESGGQTDPETDPGTDHETDSD